MHDPRHTVVFSTSHNFTNDLATIHKNFYPVEHIYVEESSVNNQSILNQLREKNHELLYATFGGSFSEGIEVVDPLTKKSKIGLIIFSGLPFAPPSSGQGVVRYNYAIQYGADVADFMIESLPTYQKLMQAAGRGIRHPTDKCAIICLDYRLIEKKVFPQDIFPEESIIKVYRIADFFPLLDRFYTNQ